MSTETSRRRDQRAHGAERRDVQWLLRIGLATAAALMATGLLAGLLTSGPAPSAPLRPHELLDGGVPLAERLCGLGIVVLSATPALRVLTLIMLWIRERDWKYVAVAVVVSAVLALAVAVGRG